MQYKGPKIVDLFFGNFHGRYAEKDKKTGNGRKPVVRPTNSFRTKIFDYPLQEKNIHRKQNQVLLIPTPDVNGLSESEYENTLWAQCQDGENESLQELKQDKESLEKEKNKWKSKAQDLMEEKEEREKGRQTSSVTRKKCGYCSETSTKSQWKSDDKNDEGKCPECGKGDYDNATTVN